MIVASRLSALAVALALASVVPALAAPTAVDGKAALATATELQSRAMAMDDAWSTTAAALNAARIALAKQDFDAALVEARKAETLARLSIAQATTQRRVWREAVPH